MLKKTILLLTLLFLFIPVQAYWHKFIAENSGTRKARNVLHYILSANPNPNAVDRWTGNYGNSQPRSFSHILFLGTPKSITERVEKANKESIEAKEKMIAKKKTEKKIKKMLDKYQGLYALVEKPEWDSDSGVSIFVAPLSMGGFLKSKSSSKKLIDFNIVENGKTVCDAKANMKEVILEAQDRIYLYKVYQLHDRSLGSDTIHIKYYEPDCLLKHPMADIEMKYETKSGKPILVNQDLNYSE